MRNVIPRPSPSVIPSEARNLTWLRINSAKNLTMRALSSDAWCGLVRPFVALRVTDPSIPGMGSGKEGE